MGKFTNLTTQVSTDEAWSQVKKSKSGTAPGHDRVTIDVWKLICDYRVLKGDLSDHLPVLQNAPTTAALVILTALVNMGLCLAMVTPFMKLGLVTMTPKVMPDGTLSSTPDKMRDNGPPDPPQNHKPNP